MLNQLSEENEIICSCSGTTIQQINALIAYGIDNLDRLSRITGACSGCGACDVLVLNLLDEHLKN